MIQFNLDTSDPDAAASPFSVSVIGIGGSGTNVIDKISLEGMSCADLVSLNCDARSLNTSMANTKVQLGKSLTQGLGCGGDPELGAEAALDSADEIRTLLTGRNMVFICVGLGGGTGSGAAPVVARMAREAGAFVVIFATLPFFFEGRRRSNQANVALSDLRKYANALITFENDRMGELVVPKKGVQEAFELADKIIGQSVRAVTSLVTQKGLIHIGMDDLVTALRNTDSRCLFGFGLAKGENRAVEALSLALKSPLLDRGQMLAGARNVLVHICGGATLTLFEIETMMRELGKHVHDDAQILFGAANDNRLAESLSVTILTSLNKQGSGIETAAPAVSHTELTSSAPRTAVQAIAAPVAVATEPAPVQAAAVELLAMPAPVQAVAVEMPVIPVMPAEPAPALRTLVPVAQEIDLFSDIPVLPVSTPASILIAEPVPEPMAIAKQESEQEQEKDPEQESVTLLETITVPVHEPASIPVLAIEVPAVVDLPLVVSSVPEAEEAPVSVEPEEIQAADPVPVPVQITASGDDEIPTMVIASPERRAPVPVGPAIEVVAPVALVAPAVAPPPGPAAAAPLLIDIPALVPAAASKRTALPPRRPVVAPPVPSPVLGEEELSKRSYDETQPLTIPSNISTESYTPTPAITPPVITPPVKKLAPESTGGDAEAYEAPPQAVAPAAPEAPEPVIRLSKIPPPASRPRPASEPEPATRNETAPAARRFVLSDIIKREPKTPPPPEPDVEYIAPDEAAPARPLLVRPSPRRNAPDFDSIGPILPISAGRNAPAPSPFTVTKPPARETMPTQQQTFDERLQPVSTGSRFDRAKPTVEEGEDLDVPTFLRRKR